MCYCFEGVDSAVSFCCDVGYVLRVSKSGVEGESEDFQGFGCWDQAIMDCKLWLEVIFVWVWSEDSCEGFGG